MTLSRHIFAALTALLLLSANAFAQSTTDLGSWCSLQLVKPLGDTYAMARLEHRSFEDIGATECYFAMAGGGYNFTKWLKADLSYEYWKIPSAGNLTTQKGVACVTATLKRDALAVSAREKYELAFTDGAAGPKGTLRSRLRAQYSLGSAAVTPYFMYEFFNGFGNTNWVRSLHYFGADVKLGGRSSLDLFYMYHLFPGAGEIKACNVLGAGLTVVL